MSPFVANLPVELASVAEPLRAEDEMLTADELKTLSIFESLKKVPSFEKFPGTTVLRRCRPGRLLCSQGEAGATAFYVLKADDALGLRERQLQEVEQQIEGLAASENSSPLSEDLAARRRELTVEIANLRTRVAQIDAADDAGRLALRHVASAKLLVNRGNKKAKRGLLHRLIEAFTSGSERREKRPQLISIDGPVDIDARTLQAPLREGELIGEMSCLNRAPRSASIVTEQDCYMLEMLRNVLDMLHKDPHFKQQIDDTYRARVLEGQIRNLPLFSTLSDDEFAELGQMMSLQEFPSGAMLFEEGDPGDCFYVIRSGLVKVLLDAGNLFRSDEFAQFNLPVLAQELARGDDPLRNALWKSLPAAARAILEDLASSQTPDADALPAVIEALNGLISGGNLHAALGKLTSELLERLESPEIETALIGFPEETENWSALEARTFHRLVIEHVCAVGVPRRMATRTNRRTLAYVGRGELVGEMGVLLGLPRMATCVAYDHPDSGFHQRVPDSRTGAVPSRVEVVRIDREPFQKLLDRSANLRNHIEEIVTRRREDLMNLLAPVRGADDLSVNSVEIDQLGLVQGQKLMLIDLERCTRCGACVDACVKNHDDGFTRLYLDGPRFDKYLVPLTCRKCLDPVCMIGCPVGAINRGDNGEIVIRNWCIGCRVCAEQCPYGSIQMNEIETLEIIPAQIQPLLEAGATLKEVDERAVVCDLCSSSPSKDPACVYACPHDAAFRVNAQQFLFAQHGDRHAP